MFDASVLERAKKKRYATPDIQKAILTMTAQEFELYAADYFNDEDQYETSLLGTLLCARLTAANALATTLAAQLRDHKESITGGVGRGITQATEPYLYTASAANQIVANALRAERNAPCVWIRMYGVPMLIRGCDKAKVLEVERPKRCPDCGHPVTVAEPTRSDA